MFRSLPFEVWGCKSLVLGTLIEFTDWVFIFSLNCIWWSPPPHANLPSVTAVRRWTQLLRVIITLECTDGFQNGPRSYFKEFFKLQLFYRLQDILTVTIVRWLKIFTVICTWYNEVVIFFIFILYTQGHYKTHIKHKQM